MTVNAQAAGERRTLTLIRYLGFRLREQDVISDDTATSFIFDGSRNIAASRSKAIQLNGAGVNGYNLSFASATTFKAFDIEPRHLHPVERRRILTTIDLGRTFDRGGSEIRHTARPGA